MKNVINAQLYQLKKDRFFKLLLLMLIPFQGVFTFVIISEEDTLSGCDFFAGSMMMMYMLPFFLIAYVVGMICAGDFTDKTTNYEIMSGHKRSHVFFARVILSLAISLILGMLISVIPVIAISAVNGWGDQMKAGYAVMRILLSVFPLIRIICVIIFVAFITKNPYLTMAFGFMSGQLGCLGFIKHPSLVLGMSNLKLLYTMDAHYVYGLTGSATYSYAGSLPVSSIVGTIVVSLAAAAIFLILGGYFFNKDDLD